MSNQSGQRSTRTGVVTGIISCVLAVLGIYTFLVFCSFRWKRSLRYDAFSRLTLLSSL